MRSSNIDYNEIKSFINIGPQKNYKELLEKMKKKVQTDKIQREGDDYMLLSKSGQSLTSSVENNVEFKPQVQQFNKNTLSSCES